MLNTLNLIIINKELYSFYGTNFVMMSIFYSEIGKVLGGLSKDKPN